jgi:hypothetical protein
MRARMMALVLVTAAAWPLSAAAGQWSKSYPVAATPDVWVSTGDGSVKIEAWDQRKVDARVETEGYEIDKDFKIIESQAGDKVRIELKFPSGDWGPHIGHRSVVVTLKVPREAVLDINTGDGSITALGTKGQLRFHTGDGSIDAKGMDGRLVASTGDGRIAVDGRFDLLDLHTGDGSVEAAAAAGSTVAAAWSVRTGDGSVTLRLPESIKANIDAHTGDGRLTFDLPVTVSGQVNRTNLRGTMNGGGGTVTVRTGDGSIRLGKY